ncbi:unnamed protein product [Thelazia callipaeda]|uniref:LAM_G_DOMAIN domain-containing protein n=1 Tax=Thelazia callipaeda TaxID=103827 RepID=A0A0N5CSY7_THECL|nr:unnamed protein product [Thelazia callipaeda]
MRVKRRGEKLLLFLDGKWEHSYFLPSSKVTVNIEEIAAGYSLHNISSTDFMTRTNKTLNEKFQGRMVKMLFNDYNVLKNAKRSNILNRFSSKSSEIREGYKVKNRKAKYSTVTFENHKSYAVISLERVASILKTFQISFKFRTLSPSSVIFLFATNTSYDGDYASLELYRGRLRYTYGYQSRQESVLSSVPSDGQLLNDFRWHSVLIHQVLV